MLEIDVVVLLDGTEAADTGISVLELSDKDTAVEVLGIVEPISCPVVNISADGIDPSVI